MSPLEARYRALIGIMPAAHRQEYGDEMVGVLMEGARPGQRFPALRDAMDLIWAGLKLRLGVTARGGRDAAGVAALVVALVLAAVPLRRLVWELSWVGFGNLDRGSSLTGTIPRIGGWLLIALALILGWRKVALALGVLAGAIEITVMASGYTNAWRWVGMGWVLTVIPFTLALLAYAAGGRRPVDTIGRSGIAIVVAGVLLGSLPGALGQVPADRMGNGLTWLLLALGVALLVTGLWRSRPEIRLTLAAMLAAFAAIAVGQEAFERVINTQGRSVVTPFVVVAEAAFLVGLPLVAAVVVTSLAGLGRARVQHSALE